MSPAEQPVIWQLPGWQIPETQAVPGAHAWPQVPQFAGSLPVLTSHPSPT